MVAKKVALERGQRARWRPGCRSVRDRQRPGALSICAAGWWSAGASATARPGRDLDASGGKWTVPEGGGFGSVSPRRGRWTFSVLYNTIRPKAGNDTWPRQVKL